MSKSIGTFEVLSVTPNKDGTATIRFNVSDKVKKSVKDLYNKKRFTKKLWKQFVIEAIMNSVKD